MSTTTATRTSPKAHLDWQAILAEAVEIVDSLAETGCTLRQCYYQLVSRQLLPNAEGTYKSLSHHTAIARRKGRFPALSDLTRSIRRYRTYTSPSAARDFLARTYRIDRSKRQPFNLYIVVEKNGLVAQLLDWFGGYGVPVVALGGFASQTLVDDIRAEIETDARPATLLYAGDFDASGVAIFGDFQRRCPVFAHVEQVALTPEQVEEHHLPPQPGKVLDSRAKAFIKEFGRLQQVEVDALRPDVLRQLYENRFFEYWDVSKYEDALAEEQAERATLAG